MRVARRTTATGATLALAIALGTPGATGCSPDFDPFSRLSTLRVLAVRGEPAAPATNETTTLSALVFTPGDEPVSYEWSWCPYPGSSRDGYPCLVTEADLAAAAAGTPVTVPPFSLGDAPTATFTNSLPPALLQQLCAGTPGVPTLLDCDGGFPVQIKVVISTPDDEIVTVKTLRLRFDPATPPNGNPTLEGLTAVVNGEEVPLTDDPDPTVTLTRDEDNVVKVGLSLEVAEPYVGPNDDKQPEDMRERLTVSWFVESGDVDEQRTAFIERPVGTVIGSVDDARTNKWKPGTLEDYPAETARIVVVVRDNRGGAGWVRGRVRLGAAP